MTPTTFREIEMIRGVTSKIEPSPLSDWYAHIRDVPLSSFGIGDLCKSLRQNLYPEHVVPVALDALERAPLAGDMYDGELALSVRWVCGEFWREHPDLAGRIVGAMKKALSQLDNDVRDDVTAAMLTIQAASSQH